MTTWDEVKKRSEESSGSGIFIRLADDGDKFVGAFVGDPQLRDLVWDNKTDRFRDMTPADIAAGVKPTPRYLLNVYVPAEKAMKVYEASNNTIKALISVREKFPLASWYFEVKRNGKKKDTKTTYGILPETQIPPEDLKAIATAKLHDLKKTRDEGDASTDLNSHDKGTNGAAHTNGTTAPAAAAPAPEAEVISPETALAIVTRLKALPKAKVDEYLKAFGVKTIKTTRKSDEAKAFAFLDAAEGKTTTTEAEVDPLA
jgi:hypothetical protein